MRQLCTIGYEGAELVDFLATLKKARIDILVDVRELPMSRRKGFAKTALTKALQGAGIDYRHEKQLGSPKAMRHRLREDWNYTRFFRDYDQHLGRQQALLKQLTRELKGNVAFMCYEKDPDTCHRSSVVDALAELLNKTPIHLGVEPRGKQQAHQAPDSDLGKSLSPA